ncbi:AAA family ATPase [archaeon]|nr:AAA family ATPase [archaeon]
MKPLIFCMGLPGTGKTTTSRILEQRLEGYFRIHNPDVRASLGLPPYGELTKEEKRIFDEAPNEDEILRQGGGIIVDRVGSTPRIKKWGYDWARMRGLDVVAICHYTPEQVAKERMCARQDPGNSARPTNDPAKYDRLARLWMEPEPDLIYDGKKGEMEIIGGPRRSFYPDTGYLCPEHSHVSLIRYDTAQRVITDVIVRDRAREFVELIEGILRNHDSPAYVASLSCRK